MDSKLPAAFSRCEGTLLHDRSPIPAAKRWNVNTGLRNWISSRARKSSYIPATKDDAKSTPSDEDSPGLGRHRIARHVKYGMWS